MNSITKIEKEDIVNTNEIPLLQSLECSIDSMVPLDPIMCLKCSTLFCSDCIEKWKTKSTTCPMRCVPFETISIDRTVIRDQLNRIKVKCQYYSSGCTQGILLSNKQNHEFQCKYKPIPCRKCNEPTPSIKLIDHYKTNCKGSLVQCFLCDKEMHWGNIGNHIESCSISSLDSLSSAACSICFNHNHQKEDCPYNIIKCHKCNLLEIHQVILDSQHLCPIKSDENYVNEYHSQLIQRYEEAINKLITEKEKKMNNSLSKLKIISNDIKQITIKQIEDCDSKIIKIQDLINYKNSALTIEIEATISHLKSQIETIKSEIENREREETQIKDILSLIQSSFIRELNGKLLLKENELTLERKFLIKACQYSHQMKLSSSVLNEMISTIFEPVISNEICIQCDKKDSKMQKCGFCLRKICGECSSKCPTCMQMLGQSDEKEKTFCVKCFSKCSKCSKIVCNNCIKKCYSNQCSNTFCFQCYEVNKHQVRGGSQICKIFKCPECQIDNICIMKTMAHNESRLCWDCFCSLKNSK